LGEEARVKLADFSLSTPGLAPLAQTHQQLAADYRFEVVPADEVTALVDRLRVVSDAYLVARHMSERGFVCGFFDPRYLAQFPLAVVRSQGRIVAFANIWQAGSEEMMVDMLRYLPTIPSGIEEYLLVELMNWGRNAGVASFNLGLAPITGGVATAQHERHWPVPFPLALGDATGDRRGSREFKQQFDPLWIPKFLVSPGGLAPTGVLAHLAALVERNPCRKGT
jgi:phosphatidylglycerol lysyltransferase